jgi:hypothetical protein
MLGFYRKNQRLISWKIKILLLYLPNKDGELHNDIWNYVTLKKNLIFYLFGWWGLWLYTPTSEY